MKGLRIFTHSVKLVFDNFGMALRISGVLYLGGGLLMFLAIVAGYVRLEQAGLAGKAAPWGWLILGVAIFSFCFLWIAVAWHRYILLNEVPTGLVPRFNGGAMLAYFGRGLLIGIAILLSVLVAAVAATIMIVLAFFFSAVSGYLVGLIGSSNNPICGLTITALVITALILVLCGVDENTEGVAAVLGVAAIVCVAAAVAGEMFQDLKAGHILGGTPWKMQLGDIIGVVLSGFVMFGVLIILNNADIAMGGMQGYAGGFGSEALPAPQASLMAILSNAVVAGSMTWILIIAGMLLCVALILMGVKSPMLVFVGMYLPFQTVSAIFVGGLIKGLLDMRTAKMNYSPVQLAKVENTGILLASGMIAGEALMGLIIAIFALFNVFFSEMLPIEQPSYWIGLVLMFAMAYLMIVLPLKKAAKTNGQK